jgi:HK97 gp10 family phage protein
MAFESYLDGVLGALRNAKQQALNNIGVFVTAEAQIRATVDTGNMRRSTTYDVVSDNEVDIGVTSEAEYAIYVEKGTSKQQAQPFIEPAVMDNIDKVQEIAGQTVKVNMGGD